KIPKSLEKAPEPVPEPEPIKEEKPSPELILVFSDVVLAVNDVSAEDGADPNLCSKYVKDIYAHLRQPEEEQAIRPQYLPGRKVTENMRAVLIDWVVQVQMKFKFLQETMYMTISIIDRFMQNNLVPKKMLQLVGVTAMFIARKYEEMYPPETGDFHQIRQMEMKTLKIFKFWSGPPLRLHLSSESEWTPTLQHYLLHPEESLLSVIQHLAKKIGTVNGGLTKHMTIKNKYATCKHTKAGTLPQLNSALVQDLAKAGTKV
uniref:G2/mitotic-specific cyclin-B1 n=1 Tax=Neovison vison TaxID=452646 RepID=A0A8C7BLY8_NEOVI